MGFVWLNLQFSVVWLVDFYWGSCVSIFSFLCHGWYTFSGVRVALQSFNGVRLSQSLVFCVMVGRHLVGFVWLYFQFSVLWKVDFQWGSCGSIFRFLFHGRQIFCGVRVAQSSFLCHGWQTFSGVRVAQSLCFCVMVGRLLTGFVLLNLQFTVSWLVDFQWGSCGSIFSFVSWQVDFQWVSCGSIFCFLCHGWQTFSGVRVAESLAFCVMVGRFLVGFVWLNLVFSVMVGRLSVGFVWLNLQVSVLCVMVDRLLVGFVWFNLQFSISWQVDFQWVSCRSIFSFVSWQVDIQWGSCGSIFSFLCHGWQILVGFVWLNLQFSVSWLVDFQWGSCGLQTFNGVRVSQSLVFCVMVGRLLVGFVWLYLQFSVSCQVDFQCVSCVSIFSFLCHDWQTFSGIRVAQSLVFCVMVGRHLGGFVWLNLQSSVS